MAPCLVASGHLILVLSIEWAPVRCQPAITVPRDATLFHIKSRAPAVWGIRGRCPVVALVHIRPHREWPLRIVAHATIRNESVELTMPPPCVRQPGRPSAAQSRCPSRTVFVRARVLSREDQANRANASRDPGRLRSCYTRSNLPWGSLRIAARWRPSPPQSARSPVEAKAWRRLTNSRPLRQALHLIGTACTASSRPRSETHSWFEHTCRASIGHTTSLP